MRKILKLIYDVESWKAASTRPEYLLKEKRKVRKRLVYGQKVVLKTSIRELKCRHNSLIQIENGSQANRNAIYFGVRIQFIDTKI